MKLRAPSQGFSLTELLVALGILGLVAAVIMPKFLNIKNQAAETAAQALASELNRVYGAWAATGGQINGNNVATSDILAVLTGALAPSGTGGGSYSSLSETAASKSIRVQAPAGLILPDNLSSTVAYQDGFIAFDNNTQRFFVSTGNSLNNLNWKPISQSNYTYSSGIGISGYIPVAVGGSYYMVPIKPSLPSTDGYTYASNEWKKVNYSSTDPINGSFTVSVKTFDPEGETGGTAAVTSTGNEGEGTGTNSNTVVNVVP